MRVVINGSRSLVNPSRFLLLPDEDPLMKDFLIRERMVQWVDAAVRASGFDVTLVLSGRCKGPDLAGEQWAERRGIPVEYYPADWSRGKGAGFARNVQMVHNAEGLISLYDGCSVGTSHAIAHGKLLTGFRVYCHYIKGFVNVE